MEWVLAYFGVWILTIVWSVITRCTKLERFYDGGIATLSLVAGGIAVGFVSVGLEADIGVFILLVLGAGAGAVALSSLKISEAIDLCSILGHKWDNCKCKRCGTTRDEEHKWILEGNCIERCSICGKARSIEHEWKDCKCERCGITRGEGHKWELLKGRCIKKCSICGTQIEISHEFGNTNSRKTEEIGNTGRYVDFRYKHSSCKRCNIEMGNQRAGMYCPECNTIGQYNWTSDGDYAEFLFNCSNCGYKIKEEYREPNSALGRT